MTNKRLILKSRKRNSARRTRLRIRLLRGLLALSLLCLLLVTSLTYMIRFANSAQGVDTLPHLDGLTPATRLLVIAPHPDDESLGTGGLINRVVKQDGRVRVVFLTNGDAYKVAAGKDFREVRLQPSEMVRFGELRQKEALLAVSKLGLTEDDVKFLGFPDRGLGPIWINHWNTPYTSPYTSADHCPYPDAYRPLVPYTGANLTETLSAVISEFQPNLLLMPHPLDDHPDHYSAYAFSTAALSRIAEFDNRLTNKITVRTYLVHRGQWPAPTGKPDRHCMAPPAAIRGEGTRWEVFGLEQSNIQAKAQAINQYRSQTAIMGRFLRSFSRSNELFGEINPQTAAKVSGGKIRIDGLFDDWADVSPQISDPTADTVSRKIKEGVDIKNVWLAHDDKNLYLKVQMGRKLTRKSRVEMVVRSFDGERSVSYPISLRIPDRLLPAGAQVAFNDNSIEAAIPLEKLGRPVQVWAGASTFYLGWNFDKTGWRPVALDPDIRKRLRKPGTSSDGVVQAVRPGA